MAVSVTAFSLLQSLVTPVLAVIQADLDTDQATVTWVLTGYLLSASVCTPIVGRIGDKVGKDRMLVAVLAALSTGSLIAAIATSVEVLIVARVIQGIGAGVLPLSFGIIRDEFPEKKVPGAVGVVASLAAVGAGMGLALAGPIVEVLNYRWLFWFPMIVTAIAGVAAAFVVPASPVRISGKISLLPVALLSTWLIGLLLALSEGQSWGWTSSRVAGLLVVAVVIAVGWVLAEARSASPLVDMEMMRLPAVWTTNAVAFLVGFGIYAAGGFLPQLAQTPQSAGYGFGATVTQSGLIMLPMSLMMSFVGLYSTPLARRYGPRPVVVLGCLVVAGSYAIMALAHEHQWELYVANAVMGAGIGLIFACLSNLIVSAVPPEQTGVASGMNANVRTIGGAIGAAAMASIVTAAALPNGPPKESGYTTGFLALTAAMVIAAGVALMIPRVRRHPMEAHLIDEPEHVPLGIVAAGTLIGDKPE
ncbi:hypothetical protein JCM18899A_50030 [Nocardioides sp. AN3]